MAVKAGRYRGVSAEDRLADRRERLLEATLEVWSAEAGPPITMTRVCAQAGLTERYFYESFRGLDAARLEVLQRIATEISERSIEAMATTPGTPTDRARAAVAAFVQILTEDPRKGRIAMVESLGVPALRPQRTALLRQFADVAAEQARELYGPRAWSEREGQMAALQFIGGLGEMVTAWIDGALKASPDDIIDAATRQFVSTAHR
ncbi:MAG: TetR/AcrR family transcriptional regulator [Nocardioides sp.]|nr:TetR/AcrR family transcriptional regulator [Nocardioides sp.]